MNRIARSLTAGFCLPLLLGGCVAIYNTRHEEPIQAAPDAALVCRYNWSTDEPLFRSENIHSYQWAPASNFGHHDLAAALRDLTSACPNSNSADRPEATISAHALRYASKVSRGIMAIPMAYATGLTLGFMPIPLTDHFAVCLDITSPDGLHHTTVAQGQLDRFINMWGSSNHKYNRGKDKERQKVDEVMRELTVHAWRKAWLPAPDEPRPVINCRDELDAIAKGSTSSEPR